ncbi:surfeit locus protein 5 subunit 22 of mediator complex-domain-containing protein [Umbelopsis sp. AD052]|nr:surfeit locus protein 5 subunit 22 of mediator complex-domain-containing protein [Umbelopsis sp. AD052]
MAGLPPQHNNPAQLGGNKPILLQLEEQYTKRVDDDVLKLVDSFADIVRVTEIENKDKFKVTQEGYQIESQTAQIIRSAESLLGLITELKQILLLNDTKTLTQLSDTRTKDLREPKAAIKSEMSKMKTELDAAVFDMENVLYRNLTSP